MSALAAQIQTLSKPKDRIALFREYLQKNREEMDQRFLAEDNISDIIHERASKVDDVLRAAWGLYEWGDDIALVAVGGYGRGELHPFSDVDLLILLENGNSEDYRDSLESFIALLWDLNLDIGHSVRSIKQCIKVASEDITVATNIMESRTLIGNEALLNTLLEETTPAKIWPSRDFFRAKWDEQIARHRKYANSEYNLEPNVKSCPGGLRDIQMIGWIAKRHYGVDSLSELLPLGFLREEDLSILRRGRDYLWTIRYALHMLSEREEDRLLFDHQRTLAGRFGYEDDDARLAVEHFMQRYYRMALALGELNDLMIQHFDEAILRACEAETILELNPRFRVRNGHIEVTNKNVFKKTPTALMEIFVLMAQHDAIDGVRASTIRLIRDHRELVDDKFRADPRNRRFFMEILRSRSKVALTLRRMMRFGVLGKYLPEFGQIIGQMQHDLFHIYSVDAHTMELVKNLRRFTYPDNEEKFPVASRIVRRMDKPELLYLAGLYHDIAKGRGGDHSTLGAVDAREFCENHGLSNRDTNLVCWLVEKHLLMSATAQRKDISDPDVIRDFALEVGEQVRLDYLYALTVADINATNPTLWNSWRASLLRQLYAETKRALRRGLENVIDKQDWIVETQQEAMGRLEDHGFEEDEVKAIWKDRGEDYFMRERAEDVVWHTRAIARHHDMSKPLVLVKKSSNVDLEGATQIFVHTLEHDNLFAVVAGTLEQLDLNIVDARIYSSTTGYSLDTFYVLDADGKPIGDDEARCKAIVDFLREQIEHPDRFPEMISKRTPRQMRLFSTPTRTTIATDINKGCSVLEVITPDRPGLLARIGRIFYEYDIKLMAAKIATLGERVEDVFFITNKKQQPIKDPELCKDIQRAICKELDEQAAAEPRYS
ncbi:[protein-PII] uridylyltransferase [Litorivivens lipolytica]|uniref:Bifunctional uridylyltransferase/uridylyl-removing enzyme n=1 Tax=Litorivivens lipolytica TaxID=1524264 RepID=A0A7W4Z5K1_9GAMM|nr:[protein-PII] uridylyltransferase [Litorivivens lipolytica]